MNTNCEICGRPGESNCSGLNVPMLWFCEEHGQQHAKICPEVRAGKSALTTPADRAKWKAAEAER